MVRKVSPLLLIGLNTTKMWIMAHGQIGINLCDELGELVAKNALADALNSESAPSIADRILEQINGEPAEPDMEPAGFYL